MHNQMCFSKCIEMRKVNWRRASLEAERSIQRWLQHSSRNPVGAGTRVVDMEMIGLAGTCQTNSQ